MAEETSAPVIFDERPSWKPGFFFWLLILTVSGIILGTVSLALVAYVTFLFAVFGYIRSRRGRTTLTENTLVIQRGLFLLSRYEVPLTEIERVEVREPWVLRAGNWLWRSLDSYGYLDVYLRGGKPVPLRAENVKDVHKKAKLIQARLRRTGA